MSYFGLNAIQSILLLDAFLVLGLVTSWPREHESLEGAFKQISFGCLASVILIPALMMGARLPSLLSSTLILMSILIKFGIAPAHRAWVDNSDGSLSGLWLWLYGSIYKIGLILSLAPYFVLYREALLVLTAIGLVYSSLLVLAQSSYRRFAAYTASGMTAIAVMLLALNPDAMPLVLVVMVFAGLPWLSMEKSLGFQSLSSIGSGWRSWLLGFSMLVSFGGLCLVLSKYIFADYFLSLPWRTGLDLGVFLAAFAYVYRYFKIRRLA